MYETAKETLMYRTVLWTLWERERVGMGSDYSGHEILGVMEMSEWLRSKNLQAINAGEGVEKREPSYTVGGNAN